jgi:hypothetical protein
VCSTLCAIYSIWSSTERARRARYPLSLAAGPLEYILYICWVAKYFLAVDLVTSSRHCAPDDGLWLWFYVLLAATFSALSIKRDKASSKLISDSGQNRISGIIQSTFYTHGLTQRTGGWRRSRTLISSLDAPHPHLFASNVYRRPTGKSTRFPDARVKQIYSDANNLFIQISFPHSPPKRRASPFRIGFSTRTWEREC